jgi:hypothetical protein
MSNQNHKLFLQYALSTVSVPTMETTLATPKAGRHMGNTVLKTSISLNPVLHARAINVIEKEGYKSFSDYVDRLIRRDTEARQYRPA